MKENSHNSTQYLQSYNKGVQDANTLLRNENSPEASEVKTRVLKFTGVISAHTTNRSYTHDVEIAYLEGFRDRMIQTQDEAELHELCNDCCEDHCQVDENPVSMGIIVVDFRQPVQQ
jgi:hypothetical protein